MVKARQTISSSEPIYGPLESTLLDQGLSVKHELGACNPPHTGTPYVASNFCYVNSDAQFRSDVQLPHSWATFFFRLSCLSPTTTRTTHLWVTTPFLSLTRKHDFCNTSGEALSAQTFNNALTVATHITLRHLATKIPSQLNNYFLPSFLPSFLPTKLVA